MGKNRFGCWILLRGANSHAESNVAGHGVDSNNFRIIKLLVYWY